MPDDKRKICIAGGGIAGLVTLLTLLNKYENTDDIPEIELFEKRSHEDFAKRPQLISISSSLGSEQILIELLGKEKFDELSSGGTMYIGALQQALYDKVKEKLRNNPKLNEKVKVKFEHDAVILDMARGIVTHKGKDDAKGNTSSYNIVINATGKRDKSKETASQHGKSYTSYQHQERINKHAAAMFFLPGDHSDVTFKFNPNFLTAAQLGWDIDKYGQPNIYILNKKTTNGTVFIIVGEFPNTDEYLKDKGNVTRWMEQALCFMLQNVGCSAEGLKELQASDDPSLAQFTNESLTTQVFAMDMEHAESAVYYDETPDKKLGDSVTVTIGNAAASANPHLASGGVMAILQGYAIADELAKGARFDLHSIAHQFSGLFEGIAVKMKGVASRYNYSVSTPEHIKEGSESKELLVGKPKRSGRSRPRSVNPGKKLDL